MYSAKDIANWFLCMTDRDAGEAMTNLKLQKLVYYAQAWALVLLDKPLFAEDFEAWAHGPVLQSLWSEYRVYSWNAIPLRDCEAVDFLDEETAELLQEVWEIYGRYDAKYLEELTHHEKPWLMARGNLPPEARSNALIPKHVMKQYFTQLYEQLNGQES